MANVINATSTGNGGLVSTGDDSGILNIQTNETTAITVDASQNVGIGTASPAGKLDVRGASYFGTPNTFIIGDDGGTAGAFFNETASVPMRFLTAGTERMRITSAGVVQVGNNSGTGEVFAQNTIKVWGSVNSGGSLYSSFGASSLSKNSTGFFTVNFTRALSSSRFGMGGAGYGAAQIICGGNETTTSTGLRCFNDAGTLYDADFQFLIAGGSS